PRQSGGPHLAGLLEMKNRSHVLGKFGFFFCRVRRLQPFPREPEGFKVALDLPDRVLFFVIESQVQTAGMKELGIEAALFFQPLGPLGKKIIGPFAKVEKSPSHPGRASKVQKSGARPTGFFGERSLVQDHGLEAFTKAMLRDGKPDDSPTYDDDAFAAQVIAPKWKLFF